MIEQPVNQAKIANAIAHSDVEDDYRPLFEQPWFMNMIRVVMGAIVISVLIFKVIGPLLKALIEKNQKQPVTTKDKENPAEYAQLEFSTTSFKTVIAALAFAFVCCFGILNWAVQPDLRPLINDFRTVDVVEVADLFNQK